MKNYHQREYREANLSTNKEESSVSTTATAQTSATPKNWKLQAIKQVSIVESFLSKKIWNINDPKSLAIHQKIINFIAKGNQPFTVTEDQGFIELIAYLQPKYLIPSRKYFVEKMLPSSFAK